MNRKRVILTIVNIFLPLMIGGMIYYLNCNSYAISAPIRNFAPDFLWFYSFTFSILILKQFTFLNKMILFIFLASPFAFELFQKSGLVSGTFDLYDIITYYTGGIIAFIMFQIFYSNRLTTSKSWKRELFWELIFYFI